MTARIMRASMRVQTGLAVPQPTRNVFITLQQLFAAATQRDWVVERLNESFLTVFQSLYSWCSVISRLNNRGGGGKHNQARSTRGRGGRWN